MDEVRDWILAFITSAVGKAIFAFLETVIAAVITWWAKVKENNTVTTAITTGLVCIAMMILMHQGLVQWASEKQRELQASRPPRETIRHWLDSARYTSVPVDTDQNELFRLRINDGINFVVSQETKMSDIITLSTTVMAPPPLMEILKSMPKSNQQRFWWEFDSVLLRTSLEYIILGDEGQVDLTVRYPFDSSSSKAGFYLKVYEIKRGVRLVQFLFQKGFDTVMRGNTEPPPKGKARNQEGLKK